MKDHAALMFATVAAQLVFESHNPAPAPPDEELAKAMFQRIGELRDWVLDPVEGETPTQAEIADLDALLSMFAGVFFARCGVPPPAPPQSLN